MPYRGVERLPKAVRMTVVAVGFFLGALFAIGSLLAVMFEVDGFGGDRDGPRPLYLFALAVALAASVSAPFLILRFLMPESARGALLYGAVALGVALLLFGLALGS